MTTAAILRPNRDYVEPSIWRATVSIVRKTYAVIQKAQQVAKARRHLNEMPDQILKDIGISRSQIDAVTVHGRHATMGRY